MKRLAVFFFCCLVVAEALTASALVLDAPHNASSHITCITCHSYSFWWQYSPAATNVAPSRTAIVNTICVRCHGPGTPLTVSTHSSLTINSENNYHGGWGIGCTDCHDPHFQDQLNWGTEAYLIEGTIDSSKPNNGITPSKTTIEGVEYDETTIAIVSPLNKENQNWPASTWAKKNKTTPDRGLILVLDPARPSNTYSLLSASDNEIVVKGLIDPATVEPNFDPDGSGPLPKNSATANTFGLIYGQLIKQSVTVPYSTPRQTRQVKFFTPIGGFVDTVNTPATGICQVCHTLTRDPSTQTARFRNDSLLPASTDSHSSYANDTSPGGTSTCTMCHTHLTGFRGAGHSPNDFGWEPISVTKADGRVEVVSCIDCHANVKGIVEGVHRNKCGLCHINPGGGGPLKVAGGLGDNGVNSTNGIDADPADEYHTPNHTYSATCADCHDKARKPNIANTLPQIHHDTASNFAANGLCTKCHKSAGMAASPATRAADHSTKIVTALTIGTYPNITNGCGECHRLDPSTNTDYSTNGTVIGAIIDNTFDNPRVHDTCTTCHTTDGGLKNGSQVIFPAQMIAGYAPGHDAGSIPNLDNGPTTCISCHGPDPGIIHLNKDHTRTVGNTPECNWCHYKQIGMTNGAAVNPNDNMIHDACTTCHTISKGIPGDFMIGMVDPASLTRNLVSQMVTVESKGGPVNCTDCHSIHLFKDHRNANHTAVVALSSQGCTDWCHAETAGRPSPAYGMPISPTDNKVHDDCTSCHNTTTGELKTVEEVNKPYVVAMPNGPSVDGHNAPNDGGGECSACHGPDYFPNHSHSHGVTLQSGDLAQAAPGTSCGVCHDDAGAGLATWDAILTEHRGSCATCHSSTRTTGNPNNPAETVQDVIAARSTTTPCLACHWQKQSPAVHGHTDDGFSRDGNCATCHSGTDIIGQIHEGKCALCHTNPTGGDFSRRAGSDGDATLADLSSGASCTVCHDPIRFPAGAIHHDTNTAITNQCATCHGLGVNGISGANPPDHTTMVSATGTACAGCHSAASGTADGVPVSLSDTMVHLSCRTCHRFDANNRGVLIDFTNRKGVNGNGSLPNGNTIGGNDGGGICTICHTAAASGTTVALGSLHHGSARATVGQCEYCHASPMPTWNANAPGDNGSLSGQVPAWPTQMACRECHVAFQNGQMTVTKFRRTDYANYQSDWIRSVAHTIPVSGNAINDYGICLGCHYVGSNKVAPSAQVALWHARPDKLAERHNAGSSWTFYNQGNSGTSGKTNSRASCGDSPADVAHYAPGRSTSGIGGFNIFAPNYGLYENPDGNWSYFEYEYEYGASDPRGCQAEVRALMSVPGANTAPFTRITMPPLAQLGTTTSQDMPVFASIAPTSAHPALADSVTVLSGQWNGSSLRVIATTTNPVGCNSLTAMYAGNSQAFTGSTTCMATFPPSVVYTAATPTLNVSTANPLGLNVTGYRITIQPSGADATPPVAGQVIASPSTEMMIASSIALHTDFIDLESAVSNCEYTVDGVTWAAGTISGSNPLYTCTVSLNSLSGVQHLNMRATSAGGTRPAAALTRTVDTTAPVDGNLLVAAGKFQNVLTWSAANDSGLGLRTTNTYDLRFQTGSTPPDCFDGISIYTGTGRTFTHTALASGTLYSYRICAYDQAGNVSPGAAGNATPWASAITSGPTAVVSNQLMLLHMDEASWNGTANEVQDSSGMDNHGTASNATTVSGGISGRAGSFNGTTSTVNTSYSPPADTFTMECWLKPSAAHEIDGESNTGTAGTSGEKYVFWPNHGGDLDSGAGLSVGTNGISVYEHGSYYMPALAVYNGAISSSQWTHVVVVYANKRPSIYINGVLVRTGQQSMRQHVYAPTILGGDVYGHYSGLIDEVSIYNKALSTVEIQQHYQQNSAAVCMPSDVTITWTTDDAASSYVEYGLTAGYGLSLGGDTLVTSHRVELTNLTAPATYHYRVRSSNASGTTLSGDQTFTVTQGVCPPSTPLLTLPTATDISSTTAAIGTTVVSNGGSPLSARGTLWGTTPSPSTNGLEEGGTATGPFTQSRTGLTAGSKLYYRGYATNSLGTAYSSDGSFYTEPAIQASGVGFTAINSSGMTLSWTRGSGDGVIVLMKQGGAVDSPPVDGIYTGYTASSVFGGGSQIGVGNFVIYKGSGTTVAVTGLTAGTTYHVAIYEYKGTVDSSGVDLGTNYRSPPATGSETAGTGTSTVSIFNYTGTVQTLDIPPGATNIQFQLKGAGGGGGMPDVEGGETPGQNGHQVIIPYATSGITVSIYVGGGGAAAPAVYGSRGEGGWGYHPGTGGDYGMVDNSPYHYYNSYGGAGGGGSSAILVNTTVLAEAAGGSGGNSGNGNVQDGLIGGQGGAGGGADIPAVTSPSGGSSGGEPTAAGSNGYVVISYDLVASPPSLASPTVVSIDSTTAILGATVTAGGGATITERGTVWGNSATPTANALAAGGTTLGTFSHTRSGLTAGSKIYYRGYASNSFGTGYSPGGSFYTEPATQASAVTFTSVGATAMTLNWIRGNGDGVIVLMKQTTAVDAVPEDGSFTAYTASPIFGSGTQIGNGNFVVYKGNGSSVTISGLTPVNTYSVSVQEYSGMMDTSGFDQGTNYKTAPETASQATNATTGVQTYTFAYTGSVQFLTIPADATDILFTARGGGGGGGRRDNVGNEQNGQNGHRVLMSSGNGLTTLRIYVGGGGAEAVADSPNGGAGGWGYHPGGTGGDGEDYRYDCDDWAYGGAGGGGSSAILDDKNGTVLTEAAGGAGGRSSDWDGNCYYAYAGLGGGGGGQDLPLVIDLGGGAGGLGGSTPTPGDNGQVVVTYTVDPP